MFTIETDTVTHKNITTSLFTKLLSAEEDITSYQIQLSKIWGTVSKKCKTKALWKSLNWFAKSSAYLWTCMLKLPVIRNCNILLWYWHIAELKCQVWAIMFRPFYPVLCVVVSYCAFKDECSSCTNSYIVAPPKASNKC